LKYCFYCGAEIAEYASYCPLCGREQKLEDQYTKEVGRESGVRAYIERNRSKIRILLFIFCIFLHVSGYYIGITSSIPRSEAEVLIEEAMKPFGDRPTALAIAKNNITISVLFITPVVGIILLPIISYNTGLIFSAISTVNEIPRVSLLTSIFLSPIFWFELVAFNLATTHGIMIVIGLATRNFKKEAFNLLKAFVATIAILIISAILEIAMITY
jgi:hypothetical protein